MKRSLMAPGDFEGDEARFEMVRGDMVRGEARAGECRIGVEGSRRREVSDMPAGRLIPLFRL